MYRDSSGKALTDYPRPSVAVDTAVLTVPPDRSPLAVLLIRRGEHHDRAWALPGTFLHQGETLARAVARSLQEKVGLFPKARPRQLHVFDDPGRDDRGWVLSVAHVVTLPWREVEPLLAERPDAMCVQPVHEARGLPFDHDDIVRLAAAAVRAAYAERPDPEGLLDEPFTIRELHRLHEAVSGGLAYSVDTFRRAMLPMLREAERKSEGAVGKPAQLYRRR